jgi:predicted RNA-binding Zn-ribbon protein involved in translation (DUF1610 family)
MIGKVLYGHIWKISMMLARSSPWILKGIIAPFVTAFGGFSTEPVISPRNYAITGKPSIWLFFISIMGMCDLSAYFVDHRQKKGKAVQYMKNKLKNLIDLVKSLPGSRLDVAIEMLTEIKRESKKEKIRSVPECPKCGGKSVVRNGHQNGKQQYLCKECGGSFVETTGSARHSSRNRL